MNTTPQIHVSQLLKEQRESICEEWLARLIKLWSRAYPGFMNEEELRKQVSSLIDELATQFSNDKASPEFIRSRERSIELIRQLSVNRANRVSNQQTPPSSCSF